MGNRLSHQDYAEGLNVDSSEALCAYWNITENKWLTNGCWSSDVDNTHVSCKCNHLSSFALLKPVQGDTFYRKLFNIITYTCCPLSMACLLVTIFIILISKKLRKMRLMRLILQINIPSSATAFLIPFMTSTGNVVVCKTVAMLLHLSTLCTFAMMAVACSELHQAVCRVFHKKKKSKVRKYAWIIAIVIPVMIVAIAAGSTATNAYGSDTECWFDRSDSEEFWLISILTFQGPMLLILLHNVVTGIKVVRQVAMRVKRENRGWKLEQCKRVLASITTMSVMMGIMWIILCVLQVDKHLTIQIRFVVVQTMHGVATFLLFIFRSASVRKTWRMWQRRRRSRKMSCTSVTRGSRSMSLTSTRASLSSTREMSVSGKNRAQQWLLSNFSSERQSVSSQEPSPCLLTNHNAWTSSTSVFEPTAIATAQPMMTVMEDPFPSVPPPSSMNPPLTPSEHSMPSVSSNSNLRRSSPPPESAQQYQQRLVQSASRRTTLVRQPRDSLPSFSEEEEVTILDEESPTSTGSEEEGRLLEVSGTCGNQELQQTCTAGSSMDDTHGSSASENMKRMCMWIGFKPALLPQPLQCIANNELFNVEESSTACQV
eukprot:scpid54805/ scgid1086/ Probable G-protein coupled receptor 133